jgi:hypothetical protein
MTGVWAGQRRDTQGRWVMCAGTLLTEECSPEVAKWVAEVLDATRVAWICASTGDVVTYDLGDQRR